MSYYEITTWRCHICGDTFRGTSSDWCPKNHHALGKPTVLPRAAVRRGLSQMQDDAALWEELHRKYGSYPALLERIETYAQMMQEGTNDE